MHRVVVCVIEVWVRGLKGTAMVLGSRMLICDERGVLGGN